MSNFKLYGGGVLCHPNVFECQAIVLKKKWWENLEYANIVFKCNSVGVEEA